MKKKLPRLMIAAPSSGSGKTTVACGLLLALKNRGLDSRAFKCGPDYIDPMFHKKVLGIASRNLDSFFMTEDQVKEALIQGSLGGDLSVIEGVMGFYDGLGGSTLRASGYEISQMTKTPVVLVIDGKGASLTLAAMAKGLKEYKTPNEISGVILNRTSPSMGKLLKPSLEELGLRLFGCIPETEAAKFHSRHLGLVMPGEIPEIETQLNRLAGVIEEYVDLEQLLELAKEREELEWNMAENADGVSCDAEQEHSLEKVTVGVARDEAFQFYYEDNLELLEKQGARLVFFSPLRDDTLPEHISGLILGGGYPENYGKQPSENVSIRNAVRKAALADMPILAECGGFLYLQEALEDADGNLCPMAGVFPGKAFPTGRLTRFGYLELECMEHGGFLEPGQCIRGHEFHYWDVEQPGKSFLGRKPVGKRSWDCMYMTDTILAGFPHLYYPSNPRLTENWLKQCRSWSEKHGTDEK